MGGVQGMPYFISMYTGMQYDYEAGQPIGVDKDKFILPDQQKSLMTSILSAGTFFGALIVSICPCLGFNSRHARGGAALTLDVFN